MRRLPDDGLEHLFGQAFQDDQTGRVWHISVCDQTTEAFEQRMTARRERAVIEAKRIYTRARWAGHTYGWGDLTMTDARRRCENLARPRPDPEYRDVPAVRLLPEWFTEQLAGKGFLDGWNSVGRRRR